MGIKEKLSIAKTTGWLTNGISDVELKKIRDLSIISAAIELRRKDLGMNQKQFAEFMGVSQAMVSKWECGEYNFTINTLIEICDKLGMEFYPGIYNLYRGRNQFKVVNIRTADKENQPPKIPTDCRGLYSQKKGRVWTIA